MLRLSMLLGCIFVTNPATAMANQQDQYQRVTFDQDLNGSNADDGTSYSVTCYMCVNVSDNLICNQYAIDRPCTAGKSKHIISINYYVGNSQLTVLVSI